MQRKVKRQDHHDHHDHHRFFNQRATVNQEVTVNLSVDKEKPGCLDGIVNTVKSLIGIGLKAGM